MFNFINPRNAVLAFAFAGFAGIGLSSFAGLANASALDECRASSKVKVVACCKQHIERFGRPIWMSNGEDSNCRAAAVCVGKKSSVAFASIAAFAPKPRCFLQARRKREGGDNHPNNTPTNNTPNTPSIVGGISLTHL